MSEFKRPQPTKVDVPEWLMEIYKTGLHKDLQEHQDICPYCYGVGWEVTDQTYNLSDNPDRRPPYFPFHNQYLIPCQHCYTGVINYCEHCGARLPKGRLKCTCDTVKKEDSIKAAQREAERLEKAKKLPSSALGDKFDMCYSEHCSGNEGYFDDWESFFLGWDDGWYEGKDSVEPERPKYVWGTNEIKLIFDAHSIVEQGCDDMYEDAMDYIGGVAIKELQEFCDKWCKKYGPTSYTWTYKYAIEIPWEEYEGGL